VRLSGVTPVWAQVEQPLISSKVPAQGGSGTHTIHWCRLPPTAALLGASFCSRSSWLLSWRPSKSPKIAIVAYCRRQLSAYPSAASSRVSVTKSQILRMAPREVRPVNCSAGSVFRCMVKQLIAEDRTTLLFNLFFLGGKPGRVLLIRDPYFRD